MQQKIEQKKAMAIKKDVEPKFVDVTQYLVSYKDFSEAIQKIAYFDANLSRMGYLKSQKLQGEAKQLEDDEYNARAKW